MWYTIIVKKRFLMENPFKYGKEVTGRYFCNRQEELKATLQHIRSSTNLIIFSQRRFGKTSLIFEALRLAKKEGFATVYVDLGPVISEKTFVLAYSRAVAEALIGPIEKVMSFMKNLFPRFRPVVTLDEMTKQPRVELDIARGELPNIEDVISSAERYQKKLGKKLVVVFDEFQEISNLENDRIERLLRSYVQTHQDICYIFCGSKRHLIYEMFSDPNRPFYKSASHYPLKKIPKEHLIDFVRKRFTETGRKLSDGVVDYILDVCEDHPYYVQFLCNILWDTFRETESITRENVDSGIAILLSRESSSYTNLWDMLTIPQKKMLVAIAKKQPGEKIFSAGFLSRFELGYMSSARVSLNSLMKKDILDKEGREYSIIDIMFKRWILKQYPHYM